MEKERTGCFSNSVINAKFVVESMPPESSTPKGTSEIMRSAMLSRNVERSWSITSPELAGAGPPANMFQYSCTRTLPSRAIQAQCPAASFCTPSKSVSGAGGVRKVR